MTYLYVVSMLFDTKFKIISMKHISQIKMMNLIVYSIFGSTF